VIPAEHAATDMSPNDTLFDAVNRGDLTAARDAIARGADFNARNELGQTPLDESIDLGRNNITFLLLSMRPSPGDSIAPAAPGKPGTPRQTAAAPAAARPSVQSVSVPPAAPKPAAAPVASNPGTPNPQRGFLGFGG
jgi:ankyrin repeat protein